MKTPGSRGESGVRIVFDLAALTPTGRDHSAQSVGIDGFVAIVAEAVRSGVDFIQCSPEILDRLTLLEGKVCGWFLLPRPFDGITMKFGHDFGLDTFKIEHG